MKATLALISFLFFSLVLQAQEKAGQSGIGETMRSNGRIYVVIAVMTTILVGLFLYLIRLDRRIGKMEREK